VEQPTDVPETIRNKALELVREAYEDIARMVDAPLEKINAVKPPSMQYGSINELIREYFSRAGAVATFAVNVELITPEQARRVIVEFQAAHPEAYERF
jgi:hypothetical protein